MKKLLGTASLFFFEKWNRGIIINYLKYKDLATYVLHYMFYHVLYMRFEKRAFNAWYEKHALHHPLKSLIITNYNPCIKLYSTFNERTLTMRYTIQAF